MQYKVKHLAVIMDGNGRWAKQRGLPRIEGHRKGAEAARLLIQNSHNFGITYLTLYAFSAENWNRPKQEVSDLLGLLGLYLKQELSSLHNNGVRIKVIGDLSLLEPSLQRQIHDAVNITCDNKGLTLCVAFSYGGRAEILRACKALIQKSSNHNLEMSELEFRQYLYDPEMPDVDLLIRTSGERRISNFLLWYIAYAELYFTDILWPDFSTIDLQNALEDFNLRTRNFGFARTE